jgi:hypothetical protein
MSRKNRLGHIVASMVILLQAAQCRSSGVCHRSGCENHVQLVITGKDGNATLSADHLIKLGETTLVSLLSQCTSLNCSSRALLVHGQRTENGGFLLHLIPRTDQNAILSTSIWMRLDSIEGRPSPTRVGVAVDTDAGPVDKWLVKVCGNIDVDVDRFARDDVIGVAFYLAGQTTQGLGRIQTDTILEMSGFFSWNPGPQGSPTPLDGAPQIMLTSKGG